MVHESRPRLFSDTVHQVSDSGWDSRLFEDFKELDRGVGGIPGGLQHKGVTAEKGRKELPCGDGHGKVPRGD